MSIRLTHRYSIRRRSETRDARGQRSTTYDHVDYVWGEAPREGSTGVRQDGSSLRSETTLRFRTRYTPGVRPGDQMVEEDGSTYYVQQALDLDGRKMLMQIVVTLTPAVAT